MVSKSEIIIVAVPATSKFGMLEVGVNGEIFNLGPVNADNGYFNFLMTKRLAMGQLTLISDSNRQPLPKIR